MLKKNHSQIVSFLLLAAVLLLACGCSTFRKMFAPSEKSSRNAHSSREMSGRDPVKDMFRVKNKPEYMENSSLSTEEKALVRHELQNSNRDSDIRSIRQDYDRERKKRQEWVFGKNPLSRD